MGDPGSFRHRRGGHVRADAIAPDAHGRGEGTNIMSNNTAISRHHAHVYRAPTGHYMIEDLRSVNGTFVNAQRIQRVI